MGKKRDFLVGGLSLGRFCCPCHPHPSSSFGLFSSFFSLLFFFVWSRLSVVPLRIRGEEDKGNKHSKMPTKESFFPPPSKIKISLY